VINVGVHQRQLAKLLGAQRIDVQQHVLTVLNVVSILRSLWRRLFARRRVNSASRGETLAAVAATNTREGSAAMTAGFDMRNEIAKLADRIVEPVAAKFAAHDLEPVVGQICCAFEQFNAERATTDASFEEVAVSIMKPIQPMLSEAEFARVVDRLSGAMAGFCQRTNWNESAAEVRTWPI